MSQLNPYDTGDRLEPKPWSTLGDFNRFGRVDFNDDESSTMLTICALRTDVRAELRIDLMGAEESFRVVVDGVEYVPKAEPEEAVKMKTQVEVGYDLRCWQTFEAEGLTDEQIEILEDGNDDSLALLEMLEKEGRLEETAHAKDDASNYFSRESSDVISVEQVEA